MDMPTIDQIRKRAFELWEQAGKPEGRDEEFWRQAERDLSKEKKNGEGKEEKRTPE